MAMTNIDFTNKKTFKTHDNIVTREQVPDIIIDSVAVLLGEYSVIRKQAAVLLLKMFLTKDFYSFLVEYDFTIFSRNDPKVFQWRKQVLQAAECIKCGSKKQLEAHHIIKWADYPRGRVDVNNGECLCHKCHTEEHKHDRSYFMMKAKCSE